MLSSLGNGHPKSLGDEKKKEGVLISKGGRLLLERVYLDKSGRGEVLSGRDQ